MKTLLASVQEYVDLRRALGFKLLLHGAYLRDFAAFLVQHGTTSITADLALRWAVLPQGVTPAWWARRLGIARSFAQYRLAEDPATQVPPTGMIPRRVGHRAPYLYTDEEVCHLLRATRGLRSRTGLRPWTFSTLFGLLAVTGLRVGEGIRLCDEDVDLAEGILTIRETKFRKSRLVPIHTTTQRRLRRYVRERDKRCACRVDRRFFVSDGGARLSPGMVNETFVSLSRRIGLRGPNDHHGPRLHDLRHRFAVRTLLQWYRDGVDVQRHLPELATYLGHTDVGNTYWYLSAIPELFELAMNRSDKTRRQGDSFSS
jgi:integrase